MGNSGQFVEATSCLSTFYRFISMTILAQELTFVQL